MYDFNQLFEPKTVEEALRYKKENPEALILAAGSDILIKLREGKLNKKDLITIYRLDELRGISLEEDGTLLIRPLTSFTDITINPLIKKHLPVLGEAVDQIGGPQIRNLGTIGGNICNGVTSADSASTLKAYDALLELRSADSIRELPFSQFNISPNVVALNKDEILTAIKIPQESWENTHGHYIKYAMRKAMDIATLGCSVNVRLSEDKRKILRCRIAFGVAAPIPVRSTTAETVATGALINKELIERVGEAVLNDVTPRTSWRASKEFRLHLIKELAQRALRISIEKAEGVIDE